MTNTETQTAPDIASRILVEVYEWKTQRVGAGPAQPQWGKMLGYAVRSNGEHNAVLRSATRGKIEDAALDLANPALVFHVVGHICG